MLLLLLLLSVLGVQGMCIFYSTPIVFQHIIYLASYWQHIILVFGIIDILIGIQPQ